MFQTKQQRCDDLSEALSAAADDELAGPEAARLDAHLRDCARCRTTLEELRILRRRTLLATAPNLDGLIDRLDVDQLIPAGHTWRPAQRVGLIAVAVLIVAISASGVFVASRNASDPPRPVATAAAPGTVTTVKIMDRQPTIRHVVIHRGGQVRWLNTDLVEHHLVIESDGARIDDVLEPRGSEVVTYGHSGTFDFTCTIHPALHGTVTVV